MRVMPTWDYWYRLEYRREIAKDNRVHEYTERVEDHGWTFAHKPEARREWFSRYTSGCAEDFLGRVRAKPGLWLITVWRTGPGTEGRGELLGSVRIRWTKAQAQQACV